MATTKKTTENKTMTTSKRTVKKPTEQMVMDEKVAERSIFETLAGRFPMMETEVDTGAGIVRVKNKIAFNDKVTLITQIVDLCTDSTTGQVEWEIYDFITKLMVCCAYCGLEAPDGEKIDLNTAYAAVTGEHGLYNLISDMIDHEQLEDIWTSTTDRLGAIEELNCSTAVSKLNEFLESVSALMQVIGNVSEEFDGEEAMRALGQLSVLAGGK